MAQSGELGTEAKGIKLRRRIRKSVNYLDNDRDVEPKKRKLYPDLTSYSVDKLLRHTASGKHNASGKKGYALNNSTESVPGNKEMEIHSLQYLRAFAAVMVVYHHSVIQHLNYFPLLHETGEFGVDIFFVISGFIMVYTERKNDTTLAFLGRRLLRVAPLYWFFTLLLATLLFLDPDSARTAVLNVESIIKSLAFVPYPANGDSDRIFPLLVPGWTLNYEMYFYLLFGLSLNLPSFWRLPAIVMTLVMITILVPQVAGESLLIRFYSNSIVYEFIFGMVLARGMASSLFFISSRVSRIIMLIGAVALFVDIGGPRVIANGVPATVLVWGALNSKLRFYSVFALVGDASYSLYLSHLFTFGVARIIIPPLLGEGQASAIAFVVVSILLCVLVSIISYYLIELPSKRLIPILRNYISNRILNYREL